MTVKTFTNSGALLDTIAQALFNNPHGLVSDDATTDDIARIFQNPRFISEVYSWLSDLRPDAIAIADDDMDADELIDAEFSDTVYSFAKLFGVEIDDYSLNLSSHRPPYIEFSATGGFEGEVGISTWREHAGGYSGKVPTTPTKKAYAEWHCGQYRLGDIISDAYMNALRKDKLKPTDAFVKALFAALNHATK